MCNTFRPLASTVPGSNFTPVKCEQLCDKDGNRLKCVSNHNPKRYLPFDLREAQAAKRGRIEKSASKGVESVAGGDCFSSGVITESDLMIRPRSVHGSSPPSGVGNSGHALHPSGLGAASVPSIRTDSVGLSSVCTSVNSSMLKAPDVNTPPPSGVGNSGHAPESPGLGAVSVPSSSACSPINSSVVKTPDVNSAPGLNALGKSVFDVAALQGGNHKDIKIRFHNTSVDDLRAFIQRLMKPGSAERKITLSRKGQKPGSREKSELEVLEKIARDKLQRQIEIPMSDKIYQDLVDAALRHGDKPLIMTSRSVPGHISKLFKRYELYVDGKLEKITARRFTKAPSHNTKHQLKRLLHIVDSWLEWFRWRCSIGFSKKYLLINLDEQGISRFYARQKGYTMGSSSQHSYSDDRLVSDKKSGSICHILWSDARFFNGMALSTKTPEAECAKFWRFFHGSWSFDQENFSQVIAGVLDRRREVLNREGISRKFPTSIILDDASIHKLSDEYLHELEQGGIKVMYLNGGITGLINPIDTAGPTRETVNTFSDRGKTLDEMVKSGNAGIPVLSDKEGWKIVTQKIKAMNTVRSFHRNGFSFRVLQLVRVKGLIEASAECFNAGLCKFLTQTKRDYPVGFALCELLLQKKLDAAYNEHVSVPLDS
jgi:hypothetical protein